MKKQQQLEEPKRGERMRKQLLKEPKRGEKVRKKQLLEEPNRGEWMKKQLLKEPKLKLPANPKTRNERNKQLLLRRFKVVRIRN